MIHRLQLQSTVVLRFTKIRRFKGVDGWGGVRLLSADCVYIWLLRTSPPQTFHWPLPLETVGGLFRPSDPRPSALTLSPNPGYSTRYRKAPQARKCHAAVRHSLDCGTPFCICVLFAQTRRTCLNPPLPLQTWESVPVHHITGIDRRPWSVHGVVAIGCSWPGAKHHDLSLSVRVVVRVMAGHAVCGCMMLQSLSTTLRVGLMELRASERSGHSSTYLLTFVTLYSASQWSIQA